MNVPGSYLHILDLQLYFDLSSRDPSEHKILKVWYNSQIFSSLSEFKEAWKNGSLKKSQKPVQDHREWSTRVIQGEKRDLDDRAGPRSVSVRVRQGFCGYETGH